MINNKSISLLIRIADHLLLSPHQIEFVKTWHNCYFVKIIGVGCRFVTLKAVNAKPNLKTVSRFFKRFTAEWEMDSNTLCEYIIRMRHPEGFFSKKLLSFLNVWLMHYSCHDKLNEMTDRILNDEKLLSQFINFALHKEFNYIDETLKAFYDSIFTFYKLARRPTFICLSHTSQN